MTITHDTTRETLANIHELLPALEGALAPTNQRALRTQRGVIAWRNSLVQALLLSGNSEAHIARVMSLTRERVRQIKNSFPVGVRTQIQTVQQSITDQRKSYKQHRAYWDTISNHVDSTQLNGKTRPEYMAFRNMLARCYNVNHPQYPDYGGR